MTRIAACQVPEIRGDIHGSLQWIERCGAQGAGEGVRLLVFPEAFLQGYFTEAGRARRHALDLSSGAFAGVMRLLAGVSPMLVIGLLEREGDRLFNSAVVIEGGEMVGVYRKTHLIGKEATVFEAGDRYPIFEVGGLRFGINICYDTNFPEAAASVAAQGARLIVCPANNMLRRDSAERCKELHNEVRLGRVKETGLVLISADVTGASDARISYGPTAVLHPSGGVLAQVPLLEAGMVVADIGADGSGSTYVLPLHSLPRSAGYPSTKRPQSPSTRRLDLPRSQ